jgi:hypothetical protein
MANALEVAVNFGFDVEVTSNVTMLGCVTLSRNQEQAVQVTSLDAISKNGS